MVYSRSGNGRRDASALENMNVYICVGFQTRFMSPQIEFPHASPSSPAGCGTGLYPSTTTN